MGLLDFAARAVGGVVGFGVDLGKAAYADSIDNKIREESTVSLQQVSSDLGDILNAWTNDAKKIRDEKEKELFRMGVREAFVKILNGYRNGEYLQTYLSGHLKDGADLSETEKFVKETYDLYMDNDTWSYKEKADRMYKSLFEELHKECAEQIKSRICEKIKNTEYDDYKGVRHDHVQCIYLLILLKIITNDGRYQHVIDSLDKFNKCGLTLFTTLNEVDYGEFNIEPEKEWYKDNFDIRVVESRVKNAFEHMADNETGYFEGITEFLNICLLVDTSIILWYYARLTPFDQNKFDAAVKSRNYIAAVKDNDLEVVLAELYVKNKLGGSALVMQNLDEIMLQADVKNHIYARALCSFLAWMECYDIELEVLKRTVANKIQLSEEMQKRLSFLADGGKSASLKVYDVETSSEFCFDTHSLDWKPNEFDMLFKKLKQKNRKLNYALVTKSWHKPYPIQRGMKFSMESLEREFNNLIEDFDGEVVMRKDSARALNLNNVAYEEAYIFKFTTERTRGLTALFQCEKFGRDLQLNILVAFMPDNEMDNDEMLQYALAVQSSVYVKSFLESILQAIDASLIKKSDSIYD